MINSPPAMVQVSSFQYVYAKESKKELEIAVVTWITIFMVLHCVNHMVNFSYQTVVLSVVDFYKCDT